MFEKLFQYISSKNKIKWFILLNLLIIIFKFFVLILLDSDGIKLEKYLSKYTLIEQVLLIGLFAPLIEELIYRFPLKKSKSSVDIIFFITLPFSIFLTFKSNSFVIICFLVSFYLLFRYRIHYKILKNYSKWSKYIFWILNIVFAVSHTDNFSDDSFFNILILISLALISSLFFSFSRIFLGFKYSVFAHVMNNCFFLLVNSIFP